MSDPKPLFYRMSEPVQRGAADLVRYFQRAHRRLLHWGGLKLKLILAMVLVVLLSVITLNHFLVGLMEESIRGKAIEVGNMAIGRVADASFNAIVERTYENRINLEEMIKEAQEDRASQLLDISIYALEPAGDHYVFSYFAGFRNAAPALTDDELTSWLHSAESREIRRDSASFSASGKETKAYRFIRPVIFHANGRSHVVGAVVLYYDREAVAGPVRQAGRLSTITTLLILIPAIFLAWWISQRLSRPILQVTDAARRVADNDLDVVLRVKTSDEIGFLAREFNRMVKGLREHRQMQKFVSGSTLDHIRDGRREMALGGSKRLQTFLFSDIRGFTSMSENREPAEVVEVVNSYLELQAQIIRRHGGDIDKFIGDEVMSVFEGDDAPLRALRAAMDIQQAIIFMNHDRAVREQVTLNTGIGINQGEVVAGNMGSADRMDFTSVGAPVNLAARLCSHAKGGEILMPAALYKESGANIGAVPADPLHIKGFSQPVEVVALTCA